MLVYTLTLALLGLSIGGRGVFAAPIPDSGLTGGQIAGIVIGSVLGAPILAGVTIANLAGHGVIGSHAQDRVPATEKKSSTSKGKKLTQPPREPLGDQKSESDLMTGRSPVSSDKKSTDDPKTGSSEGSGLDHLKDDLSDVGKVAAKDHITGH